MCFYKKRNKRICGMGKCSNCNETGHTYITCCKLTDDERKEMKAKRGEEKKIKAEERKKKAEERKKKAEEKAEKHKKLAEEMKKLAEEKKKLAEENEKKLAEEKAKKLADKASITFVNNNEYEVVIYWGDSNGNLLQRCIYVPAFEERRIVFIKSQHRLVVFPLLEVIGETNDALLCITISQDSLERIKLFDVYMIDYPDETVTLRLKYQPKKTEIDQWKEMALKSKYLLDQVIKLGGMNVENLNPLLIMVQDIDIPKSCSEIDKERAGIPSQLTNIT